jgi:hypothetical protein
MTIKLSLPAFSSLLAIGTLTAYIFLPQVLPQLFR